VDNIHVILLEEVKMIKMKCVVCNKIHERETYPERGDKHGYCYCNPDAPVRLTDSDTSIIDEILRSIK